MKKKFDFGTLLFSILFAYVGTALAASQMDRICAMEYGKIIWTAVFFVVPVVFGLIGVMIGEKLNEKKYPTLKKGGRFGSFLLAVILCGALGGGGQTLYMLTYQQEAPITQPPQESEETTEGSSESEEDPAPVLGQTVSADMVILMDGSRSMYERRETAAEAAKLLVNALDDASRVQVISYATRLMGQTSMGSVGGSGKKEALNFIESMDVIGGSNLNAALEPAVETLSGISGFDKVKAIVLLSDGSAEYDVSYINRCKSSGIQFHTVCIETSDADGSQRSALDQFAMDTAGSSVTIAEGSDARSAVESLLGTLAGEKETEPTTEGETTAEATEAVTEAAAATESAAVSESAAAQSIRTSSGSGERKIVLGNADFLYGEADNYWKLGVRIVVLILYAMVISLVYYQQISGNMLCWNAFIGAAVSGILQLLARYQKDSLGTTIAVFCFALYAAYVWYAVKTVERKPEEFSEE